MYGNIQIDESANADPGCGGQPREGHRLHGDRQFGVFTTPAVAVDGTVKVMGKVPKKADVIAWLTA